MIRLTPYLSALVALVTVFFYTVPQGDAEDVSSVDASKQTIELPLEVMHYDVFGEHEGNSELPLYGSDSPRYVESVTFDVSGTPGDLWVWGHQIGFQYFHDHFLWQQGQNDYMRPITSTYDAPYDGRAKAAIRINGGTWIDVNNNNVTCHEVEEAQACIGGASNSQRFRVENTASMLESGSNTIEFAFLGHEMLSSGYRVLDFVVLPSEYTGTLSHRDVRPVDLITNGKTLDYLDTEAPSGSDATQGEALWHERNSLVDWPGGPEIIASCNDCHAQDGRDMEFFGYSNNSITVRSMHHGLTQQEGENIAAYIRSYELLDESGVAYDPPGRPWNPPYQPGPRGFGPNDEHPDEAPQQYWSAGAGLDWIADDERDVIPYLYPDGTANHDAGPFEQPGGISVVRTVTDYDQTLNVREIPLSIQFPDWNKWLPIIHPLDAYGQTQWETEAAGPLQDYATARSNPSLSNTQDAIGKLRHFAASGGGNLTAVDIQTQWNRNSRFIENNAIERISRGMSQWASVKAWELQHEFHQEGHTGTNAEKYQPRGWSITTGPSFRIAAHFTGGSFRRVDGLPSMKSDVLSHHWYHLALIKHGLNLDGDGARPLDWNYQDAFLREHDDNTGLSSGTRHVANYAVRNRLISQYGIIPRRPSWVGQSGHGLREIYQPYEMTNGFDTFDPELTTKILDQQLSSWIRMMRQWPIEDFPRHSDDWNNCGGPCNANRNFWEPADTKPVVRSVTRHGWNATNNHYNALRVLDQNYDLSASTVDSVARLGDDLWSNPDEPAPQWSTWFIENAPPFALTMAGGSQQVEPGAVTLTAEPEGSPSEVQFFQDEVLIGTVTSAPFEFEVTDLDPGTYMFNAKIDDNGTIIQSDDRTLEVMAEWATDRLAQRLRGPVTGSATYIDNERISLSGSGVNTGVRRKTALNHVEAAEECIDDSVIEFTINDVTAPANRSWTRAGLQLEGDESKEMYVFEYLPLQRRVRILTASQATSWFTQERSTTAVDLPIKVRISHNIIGDLFQVLAEYDTTGDGQFNESHDYTFGQQDQGDEKDLISAFTDNCDWSLFTTSRAEGEEAEAAFHNVDVIRPIQ